MSKNSIKFKTFVYLLIFSIITLLLLWIVQVQFLGVFYEKYQIENIENVASQIKTNPSDFVSIENYAYQNNMCIQIISENETVNYNIKNPGCFLGSKNTKIQKYQSDLILKNNDHKFSSTGISFTSGISSK